MREANLIGTVGVAMLLGAFFLNLLGLMPAETRGYRLLNAIGAGMSCYASYLIGFIPFVILEAAWSTVAIVALAWPSASTR